MNAKLANILKIVCYVLGFPLFLVFAFIAAQKNGENAAGYGIMSQYLGLIIVAVCCVIWAVIVIIYEMKAKKSANVKATIKNKPPVF
jgi:hypothetical protein